jgi:hypothetical protein
MPVHSSTLRCELLNAGSVYIWGVSGVSMAVPSCTHGE